MANESEAGLLKRLFPRGLYGRAVLILFLPVTAVTLVVSVMFLQRHFEDVTRQMTDSMLRELGFVIETIGSAPDADTARTAANAIGGPLGLELTLPSDAAIVDSRRIYDLSGRVVTSELHSKLTGVTGVDLDTTLKRVTVGLNGPLGRYDLSFDRSRVSASNPHQLLVLMIFTSLLMSGIATIFLRNQLRPIRRLARAAEAYGRGRVEPYRPSGAVEVRSAGTAFLDMRNRLERQNEQRKVMLSGISHDLRTPLTRLRLSLSVMSDDVATDAEDMAAMASDIDEMNRMVDAFLDYARGDALESPPRTVDVAEFLQAVATDAQRAGQNVALSGDMGTVRGEVTFRPDMMRRALENLVGNAVRYGTRVEIDSVMGAKSLLIGVEDNGPGIPDDSLEVALRPFTRLDSARNRNERQGAGLGLAIAADVARGHGGQLRLGRGTRLGGLRAEIVIPR